MSSTEETSRLTVAIRPMTAADLPAIAGIERTLFSDPWSESAFSETLAGDGWTSIVAENDGEIVGYACYVIIEVESHLTNIAVARPFQRKSVAKQLLEHILRVVKAANCEYLLLEVRPTNTEAVAFYQKHGFVELYRRPNYYKVPVEDALVMVSYFNQD